MTRMTLLLGIVMVAMGCGGDPLGVSDAEPEPTEATPAAAPSAGTIERLDPALDALVSPDAVIEHLAEGFQFAEGPRWVHQEGGFLLFSDVPGNRMIKWTPGGGVTDFISPVFEGDYEQGSIIGSNGIIVDPAGQIVFAEHYNGRISQIRPDGTGRSVVVDSYEGTRFNSPNDLAYTSDGSLYFTDPAYGLPPETQGQGVDAIYRLDPDGTVTRLTVHEGANGLAFSPDQSRLYVGGGGRWTVYEVDAGTLSPGELFLEGATDGLKVDERGNLWATSRDGVWVISPEGVHLGTIQPNEVPANVAFGDTDGRTLYMTARTGLYRIRTNVAGADH